VPWASPTPSTRWRSPGQRPGEPDLPTAGHDQASWEVKLLVDHREHLVAERTRTINRLRWHLHQLDPDLEHAARRLPGPDLERVAAWLASAQSSVQVGICQQLVATIQTLTTRIDQLGKDLRRRVARLAPNLLGLPGCGVLTAAKLIAETAGVIRFRSEACFAMHAGVAPIPVSSGRTDRHRLSRGGNRQHGRRHPPHRHHPASSGRTGPGLLPAPPCPR
jgi:transposase